MAEIAMIMTGIAPPSGGRGATYVQIKDWDPARRVLAFGSAPTAGRASPIEEGDVLLAARGDRNVVIRPDGDLIDAYPTIDIYLVRPNPALVDADYLAAFLSRAVTGRELRGSRTGASPPRVPKEALDELQVPLPPLSHQRLIGGLATCLDQQRRLTSRLNAAELRLAEARLSAAFQTIEE